MTEKQYPKLPNVGPIGYASVVDIDRYETRLSIGPHLPGVRDVALWTTDQMRAYVDADRAMRAALDAEDAAHIKNLCELVRMPNAEYVADAQNAAVKYLRLRARAKQEGK